MSNTININPRAGSVPNQGVSIAEATTEKRRGPRGDVGAGTASSRLKAEHRKYVLSVRGRGAESLKAYARRMAKHQASGADSKYDELSDDARSWLQMKRNR